MVRQWTMLLSAGLALSAMGLGCVATDSADGSEAHEHVGTSHDAIVGGTPYNGDPAVVLVRFTGKKAGENVQSTCTGTLVKEDKILTAAHCVVDWENVDIGIRTGQNPTYDDPRFSVSTVTWHPQYTGDLGQGNDLAVLTLDENSSGVTPIPVSRYGLEYKHVGTYVRITGYGRSSPGDSASAGTKRYVDVRLAGLADRSFTAGTKMPPTDPRARTTCYGDSGGPALADLGSGTEVIGVASYTVNNCQEGWHVRTDTADGTSFLKEVGAL